MSNPFSVDLRALAVLRIAVGFLILADLIIRWGDVAWFMSDYGAYSVAASKEAAGDFRFSLYWLIDGLWWVNTLFVLNVAVALLLILGVRVRVFSLLAFIFLVSLHNRNPILLQGGDNLLVLLTLWGVLLPWGARFSVDAVMTENPPASNWYLGWGSVGLVLQVLSVYFFSAFLKYGPEWTSDGSAIYFALHNDQVAHLLASYWRDWHWLTVPLTHYVWWLELLGPLIALSPWFNPWARGLAAFCFITLEIGFLFNLNVGLFPFISIASLLVLLPSSVWSFLESLCKARSHPPMVMYFDGPCLFCEKTCRVIRAIFGLNAVIRPAQEIPEVGALLEREFTWVLELDGQRYIRWQALVMCVSYGGRFRFFGIILRAFGRFGDRIYAWIGRHRAEFGVVTHHFMPYRDFMFRPGALIQGLSVLLAAVVLIGNVNGLPQQHKQRLHPNVTEWISEWQEMALPLTELLRLDQRWNMFAPYPQKNDGWFLMVGLTSSGDLVDVLTWRLQPPSTDKPQNFVPDQAKNYRWRKYLTRMKRKNYRAEMGRYASAACQRWNAQYEAQRAPILGDADRFWPQLKAFNIYYVQERTPPIGQRGGLEYQLLWKHHCLDEARLAENAVHKAMLNSEAVP
ncbi:MAG: hypothetical protein ACPG6R_10395 [Aequoribacter sp.]|uniref:hypothetical protein n=1 Tax=Aequoribacter sp. TaxID=2847771 RepID=UPI003C453DE6